MLGGATLACIGYLHLGQTERASDHLLPVEFSHPTTARANLTVDSAEFGPAARSDDTPTADGGVTTYEPSGEAEEAAASRRASDIAVRRVLMRVATEEREGGPLRENPEMIANMLNNYAHAVTEIYATLREVDQAAMRRSLESAMCDERTSAERIVLARMVELAPGLSTSNGLDCILESEAVEGAALAAALDAWREQGFPPSPSWEAWRQRAVSPQIQRRFQWDHQLASGRYQGLNGEVIRND